MTEKCLFIGGIPVKRKPVYVQIRDQFVQLLKEGVFEVDQQLPSEMEMAKRFGVHRATWRCALELLKQEGYVKVRRGVGAFVTRPIPKIPNNLSELRSLTEMIKEANIKEQPSRIVIYEEPASEEIAERLEIGTGEAVTVIKRIRKAKSGPIVASINYLSKSVGKIKEGDFSGSLFKYLENKFGIFITRSSTEICVALNDDEIARELRGNTDIPVIILKQTHYDDSNRPVVYSLDYLRTDKFRFVISRVRR